MPAAAPMRAEPRRAGPLVPSGVMGMLLFVFTEAMLFAGLISANTIVRAAAQEWPPSGQPVLPFTQTIVNTAALLASGIILVVAHFAYRRDPAQARGPLLVSLLLGAAFVAAQGREWLALLAQGLTVTSSPYGGFFYVIVGTHAVHAIAALAGMGWAWLRLKDGRLTMAQLGTVEVFWYFVVLVWPLLYWRVYL